MSMSNGSLMATNVEDIYSGPVVKIVTNKSKRCRIVVVECIGEIKLTDVYVCDINLIINYAVQFYLAAARKQVIALL